MRTSQEHLATSDIREMPVSVVVPTLNAAAGLGRAIGAVADKVSEVIVVDGGSGDCTVEIANDLGARVIAAEKGRGVQLAAGAAGATSDWLLFLHADTRLHAGWQEPAAAFIAEGRNSRRAAYFQFRLDDSSPKAKRLERLVAWRCRRFGLPYGDQGLLISRAFYQELGGFKPIPLMEDVDFVRRIGRYNLVMLEADAVTSAARFKRDGYWLRSLRNLFLLGLYTLGVPPRWLVRVYG